jgi:hypothetical protein
VQACGLYPMLGRIMGKDALLAQMQDNAVVYVTANSVSTGRKAELLADARVCRLFAFDEVSSSAHPPAGSIVERQMRCMVCSAQKADDAS